MKDKQAVLKQIVEQAMLPLFYYDDAEVCEAVVRTLYGAGIRAIEFTNRGGAALENFRHLKKVVANELPDLALGIGTIKTSDAARAFIEAGADFIVSPIINTGVGEVVNRSGLLWIPGCMTPTEIDTAQQYQALLIKLFPADLLKPGFVTAVAELFPGQLFMPTGGIELEKDALQAWFRAGVCAVGMGSKLISKDVLQKGLYTQLHEKTIEALALVQEAKAAVR